jgi:hypothetical protein
MNSNLSVADASIIPSELMGQLPRRTRLARNGILSAIVVTILLALAGLLSFRPGINALQEIQTRAELRNIGSDAIGKVEGTRGYYLEPVYDLETGYCEDARKVIFVLLPVQ